MTKIQKIQMSRTAAQLARAGFAQWQIALYPEWVKGLKNRRQWRRATRKVFGVSVKA